MKLPGDPFRLPADKQKLLIQAKRLAWLSLGIMVVTIAVVGFTMGSSESMKAVWIEDILSLIPPAAFLFGTHFFGRAPDDTFPYGYRRAVMISFVTGAVALLGFGLYILIQSVSSLIMTEAPTIGTVTVLGHRVWLGWLMIAALIYSAIPPFILGRMKQPLARDLHEKALMTDANMNKGDWLAGLAGVFGIGGVAYGFWWADAVGAIIISFEILRDGFGDLRNSVAQLMNRRPTDIEGDNDDPVPDKVQQELERLDWVRQARVRLREDGDVLTGEAFVVPREETQLLDRLKEAQEVVTSVDWRLYDVNIVPVRSFE